MPILDMPIEKLKKYLGTNKIPGNFDGFWNERINEANNVKLNYELKTSITGYDACEYYDLWFDGIDGDRIYAKYIRPNTYDNLPIILQFHGYPGASRSYFEQTSFAGMKCAVLAMDCPMQGGQGYSNGKFIGTTVSGHIIAGLDGEAKNMYYVRLFQNTIILCNIAKKLDGIDKEKIFANGASQGGGIALACTALNDCVKKCAVLYPFLSDYKRVWDMDLDKVAYEGLRYNSKWFDCMGEKEEEIFEKLGYIDVKNLARRIRGKVLFGTGLLDDICPPSTQFAAFNNIKSEKKHYIFPDYSHEEISEFDDMLINFFLEEVN